MKRRRQKDEMFFTLNKSIPELEHCIQSDVSLGIIKLLEKIGDDLQLESPSQFAMDVIFDCQDLVEVKEDLVKVLIKYIKSYNIEE